MIYLLVRDQYIMAPMGGPVAINQLAIHEAMRMHGIDDVECFEKVVRLSRKLIADQNERAKNEAQK